MANVIAWVQTQNQEKLTQIRIQAEAEPKIPLFKVIDKLEKAYLENDIKELVFWLAYAKFYRFNITEGRKFFKKIEELWPLSQAKYPELANAFHFLNAIYAEAHAERNDSAQMCKYSLLLAEFSQV